MRDSPVSVWVALGGLALLVPLLSYWVHVSLIKYCYGWHGRRFCRKHQLQILAWRAGYCLEESGSKRVKTEFTWLAFDCRDPGGERRTVLLLVWLFGVKAAYGLPGLPANPDEAPAGGARLSVVWERGSGPSKVS